MIRLREIKVNVESNSEKSIEKEILKTLKIDKIKKFKINKQSIDARNKDKIKYIYEVDVEINNEKEFLEKHPQFTKTPNEKYIFPKSGEKEYKRIVVVGSGPAGLFTSLMLSKNNYKVTLIERGEDIDNRIKSVENFHKNNKLNTNSNIQFGEGGAGTFSDGKLNTMIKDKNNRIKHVLNTFVKYGAPKEILYTYKPHIGTDLLRDIVKNMRLDLLREGTEVLFNTCLTNIITNDNKLVGIEVNGKDTIKCDVLVLAIGHSARDTFKMLDKNQLNMESKPFAVGVRIQHPQKMINESQYGKKYAKLLNEASYKLTYQSSTGHGVYSFCMCPGGIVVNASSEKKQIAVNGMSNYKRDEENANSAIVVTVNQNTYGPNLFDGLNYQKYLEQKAYKLGEGSIPIQLLGDYMSNKKLNKFINVNPVFNGSYKFANLNELFDDEINNSLKEAIINFDKKIKGFNRYDAILAGVESRTSSPIRIIRNEELISNIEGIYPCGEGAGYAGGITSAAIDGIKVAESIAKKYKNK